MVEPIFERVFVQDELDNVDFYNISDNHRKSTEISHAPCIRLDFRMKVWDIFNNLPPEDEDKAKECAGFSLEERLWDDINTSLETIGEDRDDINFEIFPDMNGYRMLCDIPVYSLFEKREDYEANLADVYDRINSQGFADSEDKEEIQYILNEITEIDKELCREGLNLKKFNEIAKSYLKWDLSDDWIWIKKINKGDKNEYLLVGEWELDDYLDDGWLLIDTKHKDEYIARAFKELFSKEQVEVNNAQIQTIQH